MVFISKCCMSRSQNLSGNVGGRGGGGGRWGHRPPSHMTRYNFEIEPQPVSYITQKYNACHHLFVSARLVSSFYFRFKATVICLHLRYSIQVTNLKS